MSGKPLLYLEDLSVGWAFTSGTHAMDAEQIISFARQFDPQPFHTDPEAAKNTFFGGLVASGWHTAAVTMRLLVSCLPLAGGVIGAGGQAAWPQPTHVGDILHVEGAITEIRPSRSRPDRGTVTIEGRTLNHKNEVVQTLIANLIVMRRPPGDSGNA